MVWGIFWSGDILAGGYFSLRILLSGILLRGIFQPGDIIAGILRLDILAGILCPYTIFRESRVLSGEASGQKKLSLEIHTQNWNRECSVLDKLWFHEGCIVSCCSIINRSPLKVLILYR